MKKLTPLLLLIGALLIGYNFFKGKTTQPSQPSQDITIQKKEMNQGNSKANNTVIQKAQPIQQIRTILDSVVTSLGSISNVNSAKAVLPSLTEATQQLESFADKLDRIPKSQKPAVISVVSSTIPRLKAIIDKVYTQPGVGKILEPVLRKLLNQLSRFR